MTQTWSHASARDQLDATAPIMMPPPAADASITARAVPMPRESTESPNQTRLVVSRGPLTGTSFALTDQSTAIGRDRECDIVINDVTVSKLHAELRAADGRYLLVDGGSLNGTYVNRLPVPEIAELYDGDEIWIGKARFTFRAAS